MTTWEGGGISDMRPLQAMNASLARGQAALVQCFRRGTAMPKTNEAIAEEGGAVLLP